MEHKVVAMIIVNISPLNIQPYVKCSLTQFTNIKIWNLHDAYINVNIYYILCCRLKKYEHKMIRKALVNAFYGIHE